ncbi:hypothetical protein SAMN05192583_1663 [Sphingomonas gellani]|uniref:Uncharacterized protein n=1 Tax=Sphingomonas gellani TaxID=1166340 RepID=A0A1H8CKR0_9SPHN|nr:hypothetical protein [Sphingomonas gellani]SEM95851.1 hypothetical protein SAMN05192583_1663 [Sphingomonas gellani]
MFHDPEAFQRPRAFDRLRRKMLAPAPAHPAGASVAPGELIARIDAMLKDRSPER